MPIERRPPSETNSSDGPRAIAGIGERAKRSYHRPQLAEYGSIVHLTHGQNVGDDADGESGMFMVMSM